MSLKLKVSEDLKTAMKEKNAGKLSILRVLKGEIERNEQTANGKIDLADADVIKLAKKLVEGIKETTGNQEEISTLENYLPQQLTEEQIRDILATLEVTDMGSIMKYFKANHDGTYDGKTLSTIIKNQSTK